jgi:hypothetical protein
MKRMISTAGLIVIPNTGHAVNLEEPAAFNQHLDSCSTWSKAASGRRATLAPWKLRFLANGIRHHSLKSEVRELIGC